MKVAFHHSEDVAKNIKTFWFEPERPVDYVAGQFTEIYLPHENPDDRGIRRWFTLSSSPTEKLVGITTKFAAEGGGTFKSQLAALKPGTELNLADPMGDFVLPKNPELPLIFVTGGMGITPVRSMVQWLHHKGEKRPVRLLYAVTDAAELAFLPLFKEYGVHLTTIVKEPPAGHKGETGSLDIDRILKLAAAADDAVFYLSGPELMVETFYAQLKGTGMAEHRLVTDYFPGYQQL